MDLLIIYILAGNRLLEGVFCSGGSRPSDKGGGGGGGAPSPWDIDKRGRGGGGGLKKFFFGPSDLILFQN